MKHYIDEHFAKQGIKVIYNTLAHTDELIHAYIKESHDTFKSAEQIYSNSVKPSIYNKFYSLQPRMKKTGFENLKELDLNFRKNVVPINIGDLWKYPFQRFDFSKTDVDSYLNVLKSSLLKIENPLVFYSGGVDSELVLKTFLDIGFNPKVVLFKLVDKNNNLINDYDVNHAYEFCKLNSVDLIIKTICPEELWEQNDFINLGKELRIGSPQILTHIWMANIIEEEYPNYTYCFGGEVRYKRDTLKKDYNLSSVLVSSMKSFTGLFAPPSTNLFYSSSSGGVGLYQMRLSTAYQSSPSIAGTWTMGKFLSTAGVGFTPSLPVSGTFTDTTQPPSWDYQMKLTNEDYPGGNMIVLYPSGYDTYVSVDANTGITTPQYWITAEQDKESPTSSPLCTVDWYLRNQSQPLNEIYVTISITMEIT